MVPQLADSLISAIWKRVQRKKVEVSLPRVAGWGKQKYRHWGKGSTAMLERDLETCGNLGRLQSKKLHALNSNYRRTN